MLVFLTILNYLIQAVVDLLDKFLISTRKIEPVSYTFFTVVTGLVLLALWPWNFDVLPAKYVLLNLFSGALFSLSLYVFFVALSQGEASRVIPFVFALVPAADMLLALVFKRRLPSIGELAAFSLLIPGALLLSFKDTKSWHKHVLLKILSAFLFSLYYYFWKYGAQAGPTMNNLMWNRLGAAAVLVLPLAWPAYRYKIFGARKLQNKKSTSLLFLFKQLLGGVNFIFYSFLLVLGSIFTVNALQGFRYVFVFLLGFTLSKRRRHLLEEDMDRESIYRKVFGLALVFIGALVLFLQP